MDVETTYVPRVFSGVQPTANPHLGNYLGAIANFVAMQNRGEHECLFCVVDLHAVTVFQNPADLRNQTREVAAAFIASGIDPNRSILFHQSAVPGHAQLGWLLSCVARMGWLNRMTQFKEKSGKDRENVSVGLFAYPALMAADILLYKATHVPVGEDQKQHLELARDTAQKFNNDFSAPGFFPLPEPMILGPATRIMSLRDGTKKMSKSDPSEYSRISMTDSADDIANKIRKAKTDPGAIPATIEEFAGRPEVENLVSIYAALEGKAVEAVLNQYGGQTFSTFKSALSDLIVARIAPIGDEMRRLLQDPGYLDAILWAGAERANTLAQPILAEVYDRMGFLVPIR
jgi:tryptophanyl-tRNA synthetase